MASMNESAFWSPFRRTLLLFDAVGLPKTAVLDISFREHNRIILLDSSNIYIYIYICVYRYTHIIIMIIIIMYYLIVVYYMYY